MFQDTSKKRHIKTAYIFTGYDYDYILEEIGCQDKIEFEIVVDVYSDYMED